MTSPPKPGKPLSVRELQVLRLLADGLGYDQIGDRLGVKANTVKTTAGRLYVKLGVGNRAQAIVIGCYSGLIAPPATRATPPRPAAARLLPVTISRGTAARIEHVLEQAAAGARLTPALQSHAATALADLQGARDRGTPTIPTQRTRDSRP